MEPSNASQSIIDDDFDLYSLEGYEDYYDGYYFYDDHYFQIFDFEVPIYGYLWPTIVILTSLCNLIVICGFLRRRMRSPTNILLVSIAVSDSLTGLVTLPATFHVYAERNVFLTKQWCDISMMSRLYVSRSFHTVSVWQTVLLGIHRYLQIRHTNLSKKLCTMERTLAAIVVLYVAAFVLHIYHVFNIKAKEGFCQWVIEDPCTWTCVYIWFALLFVHVFPCVILSVLAFLMIRTVRLINSSNMTNSCDKQAKKNRNVTIVVISIVVIFLIPELPYGIFYLLVVGLKHSNKNLLPLKTNRMFHCLYELLLVISFHLNFWVYCVLFRSFRNFLKAMLRLVVCDQSSIRRLEEEGVSTSSKGLELDNIGAETDSE